MEYSEAHPYGLGIDSALTDHTNNKRRQRSPSEEDGGGARGKQSSSFAEADHRKLEEPLHAKSKVNNGTSAEAKIEEGGWISIEYSSMHQ